MTYKIRQSIPAENDLDGIIHYIALKLKKPEAADGLLNEYQKKLLNLKDNPRIYGLSRIERFARMGYHRFDFGNYIAFYTIDDRDKIVYIVRIF